MLNSFCSTDWLKTSDIVSSRSTLHYITLPYITLLTFLHFGAFVRFFPHIQIFSRLYNLPPRQAFWSSRRPDSLAINPQLFPYNSLCHSEVTDTACSLCKRQEVLYIRTIFLFFRLNVLLYMCSLFTKFQPGCF